MLRALVLFECKVELSPLQSLMDFTWSKCSRGITSLLKQPGLQFISFIHSNSSARNPAVFSLPLETSPALLVQAQHSSIQMLHIPWGQDSSIFSRKAFHDP